MSQQYLSHVRTGLAGQAEQTTGGFVARPTVGFTTPDGDRAADADVDLLDAAHVVGLTDAAVAERVPPQDSHDALPGRLAFVELTDPTSPWRLPMPAPADGSGPVPWLALVCLPTNAVRVMATRRPLPVLALGPDAGAHLPDEATRRLLAHVETDDAGTPRRARVLAPTRLVAGTAYVAALVPVTERGRQAGLGLEVTADPATLAWTADRIPDELPCYDTWTFRVGTVPRFEDVVDRLHPAPADPVRPTAVLRDASAALLGAGPDTEVALRAPFSVDPDEPDSDDPLRPQLAPLLETATVDDGTLGLPVHGRHHRPGAAWVQDIATAASLRLAAGLGARIADANRDALAAHALARAGAVDQANALLARARGAVLANTPTWRTLVDVARDRPAAVVAMLAPLLDRVAVTDGGPDMATRVAGTVADQLRSPAARRAVRGARRRRAGGGTEDPAEVRAAPLGAALRDLSLRATEPVVPPGKAIVPAADTGTVQRGRTWPSNGDPLAAVGQLIEGQPPRAVELAEEDADAQEAIEEDRAAAGTAVGRPSAPEDASAVARELVLALEPATVVGARVNGRLTMAEELGREPDELAPLLLEPGWPVPVVEALAAIDPGLVAPASRSLPADGVMLLSLDRPCLEALLAGANHTALANLAWRRYPVADRASPVRRLFGRPPTGAAPQPPADAPPLRIWGRALGSNLDRANGDPGVATTPSAVLLLRSPVFDVYPETVLFLARAVDDGDRLVPSTSRSDHEFPVAFGRLGPGLAYAGFTPTADELAGRVGGDGWFVILQGPEGRDGFALDAAPGGTATDPSWHDVGDGDGPAVAFSATAGGANPFRAVSPAAAASLLLDRPVTVALHAAHLLPEVP